MVLLPACVSEQSGKDFRAQLKNPSPNYPHEDKIRKLRIVPAFTIQALQKNTKVLGPPKSGVMDPRPLKPTLFRKFYERGEFPIVIEFTNYGKKLCWKVPIEKLDFHHYLPMFFDGLSEGSYPYSYFVEQGIIDLITKGSYKVLPVIPQIIIPIKKNSFEVDQISNRDEDVSDLIEDTLQILERYGGPDAFINIKYMIPTYESCVLN